jgi:hypothetical protein
MVVERGPHRDWRWAGRSDPLAAFGHELRNALTSLQERLALLAEEAAGPISDGQGRLLGGAREDVARIARMAHDMLAASRVRAGSVRLAARRVDLAELTRDVVRSLQRKAQRFGVQLECHDGHGAVWCHADPDLMAQALKNLLGNALKVTPARGSVTVTTERLVGEAGDDLVEVTVVDTGPGLTVEQVERLFRPGRSGRGGTGTGRERGLGIGLAIVREILAQHAGRLVVESVAGEGSRFRMVLPADLRQGERWLLAHVAEAIQLARAVGSPLSVVEIGVLTPGDAEPPWVSGRGLIQLPLVEQCLEESLRPSDTVLLTGQAATLVLHDADGSDARGAARRSVAALDQLLARLPEPYPRSVIRFGVGAYPDDGESAAELVEAARRELWRGGAAGEHGAMDTLCLAPASGAPDEKHGG